MKIYGLKKKDISVNFNNNDKGNNNVIIAVYGLGKMGLPLAAVFADKGAKVIGVDINPAVVDSINNGVSPINDKEEPGLSELVEKNVKEGRFKATTDLTGAAADSDVQIILVPTLIKNNKPDMSIVKSVAGDISKGIVKGDMVITECTMPPGSTESLIPILEKSGLKAGMDFGLGHCPERTMSGTAIRDIMGQYPKIVGGIDKKSTEALVGLYSVINSNDIIPVSNIKTAECVKVFEGIYRDTNIALANELTFLCDRLGVGAIEIFDTANTQPYCKIHKPGAVGGHCIPYYPHFVMDEGTRLIKLGREINESIPGYIVTLATDGLRDVGLEIANSNVLLLGLAFRGNVKETIKSPAMPVIKLLRETGANVSIYDPLYTEDETMDLIGELGGKYSSKFDDMDCIILLANHDEFNLYDWQKIGGVMRNMVLVDSRQIVDPKEIRKIGFVYRGIGFL